MTSQPETRFSQGMTIIPAKSTPLFEILSTNEFPDSTGVFVFGCARPFLGRWGLLRGRKFMSPILGRFAEMVSFLTTKPVCGENMQTEEETHKTTLL